MKMPTFMRRVHYLMHTRHGLLAYEKPRTFSNLLGTLDLDTKNYRIDFEKAGRSRAT